MASTLEDVAAVQRRLDRLRNELAELRSLVAEYEELERDLVKALETEKRLATKQPLHKRLRSSTVNEPTMDKNHRLAISEGHTGKDDPFAKAIRAKGFSQNSLAKRVGLNQAVLSLHRKGLRRIKRSKAEAIEKLTGWAADAKHWPVGIIDGE